EAKRELGRQLRDICWNNDVLFLVNDDIDLAAALDADGIHVGQGDMSVEHVRKRFPHKIIGLSVSTNQEMRQSPVELVYYVVAGAVSLTTTKEGAKSPVGVEWIKTLRHRFPYLPIVGIGGINKAQAPY